MVDHDNRYRQIANEDIKRILIDRDITTIKQAFQQALFNINNERTLDPLFGKSMIEKLNRGLRNRDKMKDDAIAQLSDQLMAISTRLQELERKQAI